MEWNCEQILRQINHELFLKKSFFQLASFRKRLNFWKHCAKGNVRLIAKTLSKNKKCFDFELNIFFVISLLSMIPIV